MTAVAIVAAVITMIAPITMNWIIAVAIITRAIITIPISRIIARAIIGIPSPPISKLTQCQLQYPIPSRGALLHGQPIQI
jgi:hypothetical protein